MSDTTAPPAAPAPPAGGPPAVPAPPPAVPPTPPAEPQETEVRDPAALLNAYNAEKEKRKNEATARQQLQADLDALKAKVEGKEAEHQALLEAQRLQGEADTKANLRILKSEVRAAAAGKLSDPRDALLHLDLSQFEVSADGEIDEAAVAAAIDKLITDKPYLAAQGGKRFQGGGDGGPRNAGSTVSLDEQIAEAQKARNFPLVIALKERQAAERKTAN
jgi:hypothetical protein